MRNDDDSDDTETETGSYYGEDADTSEVVDIINISPHLFPHGHLALGLNKAPPIAM